MKTDRFEDFPKSLVLCDLDEGVKDFVDGIVGVLTYRLILDQPIFDVAGSKRTSLGPGLDDASDVGSSLEGRKGLELIVSGGSRVTVERERGREHMKSKGRAL
jgi:hypothetical protein